MQDMWQRLVNGAYTPYRGIGAMLVLIGYRNSTPTKLVFKRSIPFGIANMEAVTCDTRLFSKLHLGEN